MKKPWGIMFFLVSIGLLTACNPSLKTSHEIKSTMRAEEKLLVENTPAEEATELKASPKAANKETSLEKKLRAKLKTMSLEEKVGQMFFVRCPEEQAAQMVKLYHLGGYILFGRDFKDQSKVQVIETIASYEAQAAIPLLIGVDEEGGAVNRVSTSLRETPFKSSQALYQEGGFEAIQKDTVEKAKFLKDLGINVNLAPVADVSQDPNDFIYRRSFGQAAQATATYVETVVKTMGAEQLGCVLKHFPGYGNNKDTHELLAMDERSYEQFVDNDFLPFEAGISAGADAILVAHNVVKAMDSQLPASLSPRVHEILRQDLGFEGVIITDDLVMEAIKQYTGDEAAAILAVKAGNDMLCCTNFETQIPAVIKAVQRGELEESQVDAAVLNILKWKYKLGLLADLIQ